MVNSMQIGVHLASPTTAHDRFSPVVRSFSIFTGPADIIGPPDLPANMDAEDLRLLLREVFRAAGGKHDDFDEYDRAMVDEARVAVFVTPSRIIGAG